MHAHHRSRSSILRAARATLAILAIGFVAVATGAPVGAQEESPGGIGLRLLDAPVSAKDDPRARLYIVDHLAPGTVIERRVEVTNTTDAPQEVVLYPAAASIDEGTFVGGPGRDRNDLSSWTSVTPGTATVAAAGKETALVRISVPDDAAPGEQYGVIWAEARSSQDRDGGVEQVSRVGIRLYVSVGPGGAPAADFEIEELTAGRSAEGDPTVSATVRNTGGRALDMKGTLQLTEGPGGLTAGPFPVDLGSTLAIDDSGSVQVVLDDRLPAGPWHAVLNLESGLTERSAEATLTFPAAGTAAPVAVTEDSEASWPLVLGGGALVVLLGAVAWRITRPRLLARASTRPRAGTAGQPPSLS